MMFIIQIIVDSKQILLSLTGLQMMQLGNLLIKQILHIALLEIPKINHSMKYFL